MIIRSKITQDFVIFYLIFSSQCFKSFHVWLFNSRVNFYCVKHSYYFLQTSTKGVKFSKDIHLTKVKFPFIWCLFKHLLRSLKAFLIFLWIKYNLNMVNCRTTCAPSDMGKLNVKSSRNLSCEMCHLLEQLTGIFHDGFVECLLRFQPHVYNCLHASKMRPSFIT